MFVRADSVVVRASGGDFSVHRLDRQRCVEVLVIEGAAVVCVHGPLGKVVREKAAQTGELVVVGASGDLQSTRPSVLDVTHDYHGRCRIVPTFATWMASSPDLRCRLIWSGIWRMRVLNRRGGCPIEPAEHAGLH